ncbi:MAG TPA: glycosyltransferase family 9 protein [Candidatus Methylacidiphilales bacterium]
MKLNRTLYLYYHGIGDSLLFSTVLYYLGRERNQRYLVGSPHPEIYAGNPHVKHLPFTSQTTTYRAAKIMRALRMVKEYIHMDYYHAGPIPQRHIMHLLADRMGLAEMPARPLIFLSDAEKAAQLLPVSEKPWVAIQSTGNTKWTENKNWGTEKFARTAQLLAPDFSLVQIGSPADPALPVDLNLCGKIGIRQVFQVLRQCTLFIGQAGFLSHAARAVEVPSVIVYGGFEAPWQTGYTQNINLYSPVHCAPCWLESKCPYDKMCMEMITPERVHEEVLSLRKLGKEVDSSMMESDFDPKPN